jgi:hypothetical protein
MYCRNTTNISIQGKPNSFAAAFATARETPKIAFAPKLDLYHPNNHRLINQVLFKTEVPTNSSLIILTFFTAFKTPFPKMLFHHHVILLLHVLLLMLQMDCCSS